VLSASLFALVSLLVFYNSYSAIRLSSCEKNKEITLSLRWLRDAPNMWVPWKL